MIIFEIGKKCVKSLWGTSILKDLQISGVEVKAIKSNSPEDVSKVISSIMDEKLYKKFKPIVLSIPRNQATLRNLKFPAKDKKELDDIINLHLTQEVPYSREEIIYNYEIIEKDSAGFTNIILGIMHRQTLIKQFTVFEKIGLYPDNVLLGTFGIMLLLTKGRFAKSGDTSLKACVDVGEEFTDFFVFKETTVLFTRSIAASGESLKKEENIKKFAGELRQALIVSHVGRLESIEKLYITGMSGTNSKLAEIITNTLSVKVEIVDLLNVIGSLRGVKNVGKIIERVSLSAIVGISSDPLISKFNFVLPEAKMRKDVREMTKNLFVMGGIIIYLIVVFLLFFMSKLYTQESYLNKITGEIKKLQQTTKGSMRALEKIKTLQIFMRYKDSFLYYYYELAQVVPENITIDRFTYNKKREISLVGKGTEMGEVFKFVRNLNSSGIFGEAELKYSRKASKESGNYNEFNITCNIK
ncbi:MAG: pilus assembly protein PilM [Candidatus Omnitrophica bacterium]|nr:pilus assembly protein PilM [Candidatus Omnitrophota bacterium]